MTMSLVCTSTNTISKQEHMATPSLNDQPFIDTTPMTEPPTALGKSMSRLWDTQKPYD